MKKIVMGVVVSAFFCSCNKTWFENTTHYDYRKQKRKNVIVYTDGRPVPKEAEEIGIINYKASNTHKAIRRCRREGAIHGANAIYAIKPVKDRFFIGPRGQFKAVYIPTEKK